MPKKKSRVDLLLSQSKRRRSKPVEFETDDEIVVASPVETQPEIVEKLMPEPIKPTAIESKKIIEEDHEDEHIDEKSSVENKITIEDDDMIEEKKPIQSDVVKEFPKKLVEKKIVEQSPSEKLADEIQKPMEKDLLFALDIGTRSVIGIVAEKMSNGTLKILATTREEHKTRSMLDGQIHDVPQVAAVIRKVKSELQRQTSKLRSAAVAAAGRALYTMTAEAEMDISGTISHDQQGAIDFAGVQAAQEKLAASQTIEDPTRYYCVGYSVIKYELDDITLKTLIGQRGRHVKVQVIATFLPRQVIDSMQSALQDSALEMRALTLEPIAAINVLIPPTMRHLNIVLVDIGAGTSDIAITRSGTVVAYGMVPVAGDEITEAISQKFLLDFNIAEQVKRQAASGDNVEFQDILGITYNLPATDIIEPILPNIRNLAEAISKTILELNAGDIPQAVMLVGGGSMTPMLQQMVSKALGMTENRVAVRTPNLIDGISDVPSVLHSPDAVTPLGILKVAANNTLHFLKVYVNDEEYSLFHFRDFTVADALLNAGIQMRKYNGRPGLGLMITVEGEKKSFPGSLGTLANITVDGKTADLETKIENGARIKITAGSNGKNAEVRLSEVVTPPRPFAIYINEQEITIVPKILLNGIPVEDDRSLADGDIIETRIPRSVGEALKSVGLPPTGMKINFKINGSKSHHICSPKISKNDELIPISEPIRPNDSIEYIEPDLPKLSELIDMSELEYVTTFFYEGKEYKLESPKVKFEVNGRPASVNTIINEGAEISFEQPQKKIFTVSDALLAVNFKPPESKSRTQFEILINGRPVDFIDRIKSSDRLEVVLKSQEEADLEREAKKSEPKSVEPEKIPEKIETVDDEPEYIPMPDPKKENYAASLIARLQAQINQTNAVGNAKILKKISSDSK